MKQTSRQQNCYVYTAQNLTLVELKYTLNI